MKTIDILYDGQLLFIGCVAGILLTLFVVGHYHLKPLEEEKKRAAAVHDALTNASFLCGMWRIEKKIINKEGELEFTLSAADRSERVLQIPADLNPELRKAWKKKRQGELVEITVPSGLIREYLDKGGNSPRPVDLIAPDSINEIEKEEEEWGSRREHWRRFYLHSPHGS